MPSIRTLPPLAGALLALALAATASHAAPPPAFDRANLDTTCAPCRDFFKFANGGWIAHATIPPSRARWGIWDELAMRNHETLHQILVKAAADRSAPAGSDTWKLGTYWRAAMDSAGADRAGAAPVMALLKAVDGVKDRAGLARQVAWLQSRGIPSLFGFRVGQDPANSDLEIANAEAGGLGLPDRDYYFRADSASRAIREAYVGHLAKLLQLAGTPPAAARAQAGRIMEVETALAGYHLTNVQRRDPRTVYHKVAMDSLRRLMTDFDWNRYLAERGKPDLDSINVTQPRFFQGLDSLLAAVPLDTWKAVLRADVLDEAAPMLGRAFADEAFAFQRTLSGAQAMEPRWRRAINWADRDLGDLLGKAYVKERFSPEARERALTMVRNLEASLGDRIAALDWMSDATKAAAKAKLDAFANKIGYPDTWRDYAGVTLVPNSLFANHLATAAYESKRNLDKLGKPVDRGEWFMTPPTVNAFYSGSLNSINFPAGILQPPFYDPSWDDAMNYGGIGAVIGHEMSHGFDDRGRQFDLRGNLRDWWTAEDAARYRVRADKVADQFSGYTVLDTLHLNGRLTLGENIADLGGLAVAYHALEKALGNGPRPLIDGFTPEQRFFLSWAQVWREIYRPAAMRTQVLTNPHSPSEWRVNGPLSNLPEFAQAFGCKAGDPMVRAEDQRVRIW